MSVSVEVPVANSQMRCITCGLPLSPARTSKNCPRCGTINVSGQRPEARSTPPNFEPARTATSQGSVRLPENYNISPPLQTNSWNQRAMEQMPFPPSNDFQARFFEPVGNPVQEAGSNVSALSPQNLTPIDTPTASNAPDYVHYNQQQWLPNTRSDASPLSAAQPFQRPPSSSVQNGNKTNLRLLAAGLCIILGGLILFFVYFMEMNVVSNRVSSNGGEQNGLSTTSTPAVKAAKPSPTRDASISITATPFPGQQFISNALMASSVDPNSARAIQPATTFKVNQKMYITFQLHANSQAGAACLLWYLNGKMLFNFPLVIYAYETNTYSYATYGGTGAGHVEIYWASSTKCSDQVLAQQVDFTVTS